MSSYRTVTTLPDDFDLEALFLLEEPKTTTVPVGPPGRTGTGTPGVSGAGFNFPQDHAADGGVSTFDWGDTIRAQLAATGKVDLSPGRVYYYSGTITVEAGQLLSGFGGSAAGVNAGLSTLQALDSTAMVWVRGAGAQAWNLHVKGNSLATCNVKVGGTGTGDAGTSPILIGVSSSECAAGGKNFWISKAQNGVAIGCNSLNAGGEGWSITDGAAGWTFLRLEATGSASYNLHINACGSMTFIRNTDERGTSAALCDVLIEGGVLYPTIVMDGMTFASGGSNAGPQALFTGATVLASTDTFTKTAHGMFIGQPIQFTNITGATGISAATTYWVATIPTANTFTVASTYLGTTPVNITVDGSADVSSMVRYLVQQSGAGLVEYRSCAFAGIPNEVGLGLASSAQASFTGAAAYLTQTIVSGVGMPAFVDGDSSTFVHMHAYPMGQVSPSGTVPLHTSRLPFGNIARWYASQAITSRTSALLPYELFYQTGQAFAQSQRLGNGTMSWGPGTGTFDTIMGRASAGLLGLTGGITATQKFTGTGWRNTRHDQTAVADGTITLDADNFDLQHVFMGGHNVTLAISGGTNGQFLYVYVQQNATPGTLTLPVAAGGVLWTGGDAGKPTLTTATGWLTFVLECLGSGVWIERSRGGTNVVLGAVGGLIAANDLSDVHDTGTSQYNLHVAILRAAQVVATANVASLSGTTTIDGVALVAGDRVLLTAQTTGSQNGPWLVAAGAWTRPTDYPAAGSVKGRTIQINAGSTPNAGSLWAMTTSATVTIDTTATTWAQVNAGTYAPLASPALTGNPTAPTQSPGDNTTKIATTAFTAAAITALIGGAPGALDTLKELADAINDDASYAAGITTALGLKAPLASPALTGAPTAPTQSQADNSTKLATTAYVDTGLGGKVPTGGYGITSGAVALTKDSASLGGDVTLVASTLTTLFTTASLGIGAWLLNFSALVSGTATVANFEAVVNAGTATATFSGARSAGCRPTASSIAPVTISVYVTVTVAGTLLIQCECAQTPTVKATSPSFGFAGATGYTAVRTA